jgi:UDP-N-acetylmuramate dehydrogenase
MDFSKELKGFSHAKITFEQPMKKFTTLGVGGCADYFAEVDSLYGLNLLISLAKEYNQPYFVLGNGTNILISDKGYRGLIICLKKLNDVFFKRDLVRAMAGANIDKVLKFNLANGLTGLERLSGIPATIGGAIVMNAGAFGHNISDHIVNVQTLYQGKINSYDKEQCEFAYRKSRFLGRKEIIISATFNFEYDSKETIEKNTKNYADLRRQIQPIGKSCGSVFKNPKGYSAGELIDRANLKGLRIGGALVSERHANFIITEGKAKAEDVYLLIDYIKKKAKDEMAIDLIEEIEYVGEF